MFAPRAHTAVVIETRTRDNRGVNLAEAFLYGGVQGITEYLPVSSSAHLILLPRFLGTEDPGLAFDVFLHLGTLGATLSYYWRDWVVIAKSFPRLRNQEQHSTVSWDRIVIATLPVLLVGAVLHHWVSTVLRGNSILMGTLVLGGLALVAADRLAPQTRKLGEISRFDALAIGIFQCLALVPGMSRSGSTIMGARALGLDRAASARFSFLISAPVTAAAFVFELRKWRELVESSVGWPALIVAALASFVFGAIAIGLLIRLVRKFSYTSFAVYRIFVALAIWKLL